MLTEKEIADTLEFTEWLKHSTGISSDADVFGGSDWLVIIKLHALIETGLNDALKRCIAIPELEKVIGKLDTSNPTTGKVAFAKALGILPNQSAAFLQVLSELRNLCVHNIRNFSFDLKQHLAGLKPAESDVIRNRIAMEIIPAKIGEETIAERVLRDPLFALKVGTMNIMMCLYALEWKCRVRDLEHQTLVLKAAKFDEQNPTIAM